MQTSVAAAAESKQMLRALLSDILLCVALLVPSIICEYVLEPHHSGFFCNDESLKYPYRAQSVDLMTLLLLVLLLQPMLIVAVEFGRCFSAADASSSSLSSSSSSFWLLQCIRQCLHFLSGYLFSTALLQLSKFRLGRLRPHFMDVCEPQLLNGGSVCDDDASFNNPSAYIEDYVCASVRFGARDFRQARLSFPSGHATHVFYATLYMTIYLQRRMRWRGARVPRQLLQFALILGAWYIALSRITDYWHHYSDVVVGAIIGSICALLNAYLRAATPIKTKTTTTTIDVMAVTSSNDIKQQQQLQTMVNGNHLQFGDRCNSAGGV